MAWHRRRVLVMGLGLHGGGLALTKWLLKQGAIVRVTDLKSARELAPSVRQLPKSNQLTLILGRHREADFHWAQLVVQNPGVPRESKYLATARRAGAQIENEATLFVRLVDRSRVIGVTGTRGKSTTAALAAHLLRRKYPQMILAGNIATTPMFAVVGAAQRTRGPVVLELSSWHLENLGEQHWSPHVAVVTNVLADHLNRYRTLASYAAAKANMVRFQTAEDVAVLNLDNAGSWSMRRKTKGNAVGYSLTRSAASVRVRGGWLVAGQRICRTASVSLGGEHNLSNALAAVAVAQAWGVSPRQMAAGLRSFSGLAYRQQEIASIGGIRFINDTAATSPDATIAALQRFGRQAVLIAGGADKRFPQGEIKRLAQAIGRGTRAALLFSGSGSDRLANALNAFPKLSISTGLTRMTDAVALARAHARPGDVVLLSPGFASFGLFQHEFDRGDQFTEAVKHGA